MRGLFIKVEQDRSLGGVWYAVIKKVNESNGDIGIHEPPWGNSNYAEIDATIIHNLPVWFLLMKYEHGGTTLLYVLTQTTMMRQNWASNYLTSVQKLPFWS